MLDKTKRYLVVGLGLLGGKYALELTKAGFHVDGINRSEGHLQYALDHGYIASGKTHDFEDLVQQADHIIFGLYPTALLEWFKAYGPLLKPGCIFTDVSGVKTGLVEPVQAMCPAGVEFIASHPMAGRETSSVEHAAEVNFAPANFIITPTEKNTPEAIQWAKDGKWVEGTTPYYLWMGHELQGRKVGFVGFGAVGRAAAKIMDGFDCDICFYDPFIPNDIGHYKKTELEKIFAECDIVSLHLPVTDETRGMIDEKLLRSMKPTALFVNSARSAVVDTKALIKLLNDKAIAGAIIDVLDTEPPTAEDLQIAYCPNTILTPHIGGSSFEVTVHQADILNERIRQWLKGENLERIVFNRAVLAK